MRQTTNSEFIPSMTFSSSHASRTGVVSSAASSSMSSNTAAMVDSAPAPAPVSTSVSVGIQVSLPPPLDMHQVAAMTAMVVHAHALADPVDIARRVISWMGRPTIMDDYVWNTVYAVALAAVNLERAMADQILQFHMAALQLDPSGCLASTTIVLEMLRRRLRHAERMTPTYPDYSRLALPEPAIDVDDDLL